jgi:hypothetical protein
MHSNDAKNFTRRPRGSLAVAALAIYRLLSSPQRRNVATNYASTPRQSQGARAISLQKNFNVDI